MALQQDPLARAQPACWSVSSAAAGATMGAAIVALRRAQLYDAPHNADMAYSSSRPHLWPSDPAALMRAQRKLAALSPPPWRPSGTRPLVGACYVCFARGGSGRGRAGERGWAAAVLMPGSRGLVESAVVVGVADAPYEPGLLALREGPLLAAALRALEERPEVLLCNATGRDHPRAAGLALQLGALLDLPSVGVTDRPLHAEGPEPGPATGATSPLRLHGAEVARMLRTRAGARPVVVHPGWRTDLDTATGVVRASIRRARTPEPLRRARQLARHARAAWKGPMP